MPANAFILATKAMPASLSGERSRAFCFPHLLNLLEKAVQCAALTMAGSIGFDIGSDFLPLPLHPEQRVTI